EYDKPQWVLRQEEQQRRQNAEIAAFLGERRYGLFMDYMDTIEACRLMRRLESTLAGTLDALAVGQFQPLVTAVAEGKRRYLAERETYASPTGLERIARFHERMREAAQPYLAPGQFAHFSQYLDAVYEAEKKRVEELYVTRGRSQLDQQ